MAIRIPVFVTNRREKMNIPEVARHVILLDVPPEVIMYDTATDAFKAAAGILAIVLGTRIGGTLLLYIGRVIFPRTPPD